VMVLIVTSLFGCVLTAVVVVTLYIPCCVDHFPKRHMMCADVSFTGLLRIIVSSVTFLPCPSPFFILM
jgi:hypothetical protein